MHGALLRLASRKPPDFPEGLFFLCLSFFFSLGKAPAGCVPLDEGLSFGGSL